MLCTLSTWLIADNGLLQLLLTHTVKLWIFCAYSISHSWPRFIFARTSYKVSSTEWHRFFHAQSIMGVISRICAKCRDNRVIKLFNLRNTISNTLFAFDRCWIQSAAWIVTVSYTEPKFWIDNQSLMYGELVTISTSENEEGCRYIYVGHWFLKQAFFNKINFLHIRARFYEIRGNTTEQ